MFRPSQILFGRSVLLCVFVLFACTCAWAQDIHVTVNGDPVAFSGTGPMQINGRVMVPVRGVLEKLGANVEWVPATQSVIAENGSVTIQLRLGDRQALVNGKTILLDVSAQAIAGHTMVPLRFIGEALGADVKWDGATRTVLIQTQTSAQPGADIPAGNGVTINRMTVMGDSIAGWIQPGEILSIRMDGTPGGRASFHITGVTDEIALDEETPGRYTGSWTVPAEKDIQVNQTSVVGSLKVGDRAASSLTAPQTLSIDTVWPVIRDPSPERESRITSVRPTITAAFDDRNGSGVNAAKVRLIVNDEDVTTEATITRNFMVYSPKEQLPPGRQRVRLFVPDRAGNIAEANWTFTIEDRTNTIIRNYRDNTDRIQAPGDTLHVEINGLPGGQAAFSLGNIRDIPLRETDPGHYVGDYVLREEDDPGDSRLVYRLITPNGERYVQQTDRSFRMRRRQPVEPLPNGPIISGITLIPENPSGWLQAGQQLNVRMEGTPRGTASFHIGDLTGEIPMGEVAPGRYAGTWRVPGNRNLQQSDLTPTVSLRIGNQITRLIPQNQTVAVDMAPPVILVPSLTPRRDSQTNAVRPTISATFDDPNGSGVDRRRIRLEVNGRNVTSSANVRTDSVSYTPNEAFAPGRQSVRLIVADKAGNTAEITWYFTVTPNVTDGIRNVKVNADGILQPGDVLHVEMQGIPGGAATFSVGTIQDVPMQEVSAGRYVADYTIRRRDQSDKARLTVRLSTANGLRFAQETGYAVTIQPARPVPDTSPNVRSVTFVGNNRSGWLQSGQRLNVTLEGAPGGTATYRIGNLTGDLPMREATPGHYIATWIVPTRTDIQRGDLILYASLQIGNQVKRVQADKAVAIDTVLPVISNLSPRRDSQTNAVRPIISATFTDPNGSGVDKSKIRLEVNGRDVTSSADVRIDAISYTPKDAFEPGKQTIHLVVIDKAGNLAETTWYVTVR